MISVITLQILVDFLGKVAMMKKIPLPEELTRMVSGYFLYVIMALVDVAGIPTFCKLTPTLFVEDLTNLRQKCNT